MSLRRKFAVIAVLYVIEGFPMAIFRDVWSVYLRWETSCQALVAHAVMDFSVGCAIAPVASAGPDLLHCSGQSGG